MKSDESVRGASKDSLRIKRLQPVVRKQEFIAHKTTTTCCSHRCANLLYKQKKREASIRTNNQVVEKVIKEKPIEKIRDKPILTITEAATYIGVTRPTLYGYLKRGELKASRLGYKFLLKKEDIDNLFNKPIEFKIPVRDKPSMISTPPPKSRKSMA